MSDYDKNIQIPIQVDTSQPNKEFQSIVQQLKKIQQERDKIVQQKHSEEITGEKLVKLEERLVELQQKEKLLLKQKLELESLSAVNRDKALQKEAETRYRIAQEEVKSAEQKLNNDIRMAERAEKLKSDLRKAAIKAEDDELAQYRKNFLSGLQKQKDAIESQIQRDVAQIERSNEIGKSQRQSELNEVFGRSYGLQQMVAYQTQLSRLNQLAQTHWQLWKNTGDEIHKVRFDAVEKAINTVHKRSVEFNKEVGIIGKGFYALNQNIDYFLAKFRSHTSWLLSGTALAGIIAVPGYIQKMAIDTEVLTQKIKQNLELSEEYVNNHKKLAEDVKHLQEVAGLYAVGYGADLVETLNAMNIISRRFKDTNAVNYITSLALTLHKLDFVPLEKAASDLEAVILQFGLDANQTKDFVNQFSYAVHTARINGTELLDSLQRSGSMFKQYGADTKTAIATVSALATTTARTGAVIGNSWKSILSSTQKDKVLEAFEQLGVEIYNIGESGEKITKDFDVLFSEIMQKWSTFDQETRNKFSRDWAGTYQLNQLSSFLNDAFPIYQQLMQGLSKVNDELTAKLLATGLDTYKTRLDQLTASWQVFSTTLGYQVTPAMKEVIIGLTQGITYLNEHRDAVANAVSAIGTLIEALILYRGWQFAADSALGKFIGTSLVLAGNAPSFVSAVKSMGSSIAGFAMTLAGAATRLLFFIALAEIVSGMIATYKESKDISSANQYYKSKGLTSRGFGGKTDLELLVERRNAIDSELSQINESDYLGLSTENIARKQELQIERDRIAEEIQEKIHQAQIGKMVDRFKEIERDALSKIQNPNLARTNGGVGTTNIPNLGDKDKDKRGSSSSLPPSDHSSKLFRDEFQAVKNKLFLEGKLLADRYAESLDNLKTKEDLYGQSIQTTIARYSVMRSRVAELIEEENKYNNEAEYLSNLIDDQIGQNGILRQELGVTLEQWNGMTKEQRQLLKLQNREFLEQHDVIKALVNLMNQYKEKASDTHKEVVKINNELLKIQFNGIFDPEQIYKRQLSSISAREDITKASINKRNPFWKYQEQDIEYVAELQRYNAYLAERRRLQDEEKQLRLELPKTIEELEKLKTDLEKDPIKNADNLKKVADLLAAARRGDTKAIIDNKQAQEQLDATIAKSKQRLDELKDKYESVRKFWADSLLDMADGSKKFSDILKDIWRQIAKEAIYSIFKIQQTGQSAISLLGKGKGKGRAGATVVGGNRTAIANNLLPTSFGHADGGIFDKEHIARFAERNKREAVIPLEDNRQRGIELWLQSGKELGMFKGTQVTPYLKNPELNNSSPINIQVKQSEKYIQELQRQNELMVQQNQMILQLVTNGGSGGTTIAQPIIMQQTISMDDLANMLEKMKSMGYRV